MEIIIFVSVLCIFIYLELLLCSKPHKLHKPKELKEQKSMKKNTSNISANILLLFAIFLFGISSYLLYTNLEKPTNPSEVLVEISPLGIKDNIYGFKSGSIEGFIKTKNCEMTKENIAVLYFENNDSLKNKLTFFLEDNTCEVDGVYFYANQTF